MNNQKYCEFQLVQLMSASIRWYFIALSSSFQHRTEKVELKFQLEHKDKELERTKDEVENLRALMEKKIVNFEVEKRYKICV